MRKLTYAIAFLVWAASQVTVFGQNPPSTEFQQSQTSSGFLSQQKGAILSFHVVNNNTRIVADVYSLSGKHVARVLDQVVSQGDYSFNPFVTCKNAISRQTYIVRLNNGIETESIRMLNLYESVSNLQSIRTSSAILAKVASANASNKVITGVVTDASNNSPLNQVKVSLDSVTYVFTDINGKFTIGVGNLVSTPTNPRYLIFEYSEYVSAVIYINPDSQQTSVQLNQIAIDNANRPASAIGDMVITPFGLRPRSQCFGIVHGHSLDNQGGQMREIDASGHLVRTFERITNAPEIIPPSQPVEWITCGFWTNTYSPAHAVKDFSAGWTVPSAPSTNHGQLIYLFNGIQQYLNNQSVAILQPVLQWGYSGIPGSGYYYALASWYYCNWGTFYTSPVYRVNPGAPLIGDITAQTNNAPGIFTYSCIFQNIWATNLIQMNIPELTQNVVTLEAYNNTGTSCPQYCTDYPASGYTIFGGLSILTDFNNPTYRSLTWTGGSVTTNCNNTCNAYTMVYSNANPNGKVFLFY